MEHDQKRLGITGSLQFKPSDRTVFTLDALYSKIDAVRDEKYIEAICLQRSGTAASRRRSWSATASSRNGALVYGAVRQRRHPLRKPPRRMDHRRSRSSSLDGEHRFSDNFTLTGKIGTSTSDHSNPIQTTIIMDRLNVDGYSYDYRGNPLPAGDQLRHRPDQSRRLEPVGNPPARSTSTTASTPAQLDFNWNINPSLPLRGGVQAKNFGFGSTERRAPPTETIGPELRHGTRRAGRHDRAGQPQWPDGLAECVDGAEFRQVADTFDIYSNTGTFALSNCIAHDQAVEGEDRGAYLMGEFSTDLGCDSVLG